MSKPIYLKLDTYKGIITIPFKDIEHVDQFTVIYDYMGQLVSSMINMLKLPLSLYDVNGVYLTYDKYNGGFDINTCLPIKYSCDNFNFESLKDAFAQYIRNDQGRILTTHMKYVKCSEISRYFDRGFLDNYEIERAVRAFFGERTGYKRRRDTYFLIKYSGDDISIKIDSLDFQRMVKQNSEDLSVYSKEEDNYFSHLIELSERDPEAFSYVMDEIGKSDLEEISSLLQHDGYGIVDGVSKNSKIMRQEISLLESTTEMSIDELRVNYAGFGRRCRRKK